MPLQFSRLEIPDVVLIRAQAIEDRRGFFIETYKRSAFADAGIPDFVQDNYSHSVRGVLRGLHYQKRPKAQGKLVGVVRGTIFDVAVDIRRGSPSFGRWFGLALSDANKLMLWIPPGFAHGFCAIEDDSDLVYKCTRLYDPPSDRSILWNDPAIGIEWPIAKPVLSAKDANAPRLAEATMLPAYA